MEIQTETGRIIGLTCGIDEFFCSTFVDDIQTLAKETFHQKYGLWYVSRFTKKSFEPLWKKYNFPPRRREHGFGEHGFGEHGFGEHGFGEHGFREHPT